MSPQSRGRKRRSTGRGRNEPPGPDVLIARMARGAFRELEDCGDALDAELYVSELFGAWWGQYLGGQPRVPFAHVRVTAHEQRD